MKIVGMDVGSTTVKAVVVEAGAVLWRDYQRHNTRQAEKVLEFLRRIEHECGLAPGRDRIFFTGSGSGLIAPMVGGKVIQEDASHGTLLFFCSQLTQMNTVFSLCVPLFCAK